MTEQDGSFYRTLLFHLHKASKVTLRGFLVGLGIGAPVGLSIGQMRTALKGYMTTWRKGKELADVQVPVSTDLGPSEWPQPITDDVKLTALGNFRAATSSEALATLTCASCAEDHLKSAVKIIPVTGLDLTVLARPDRRVRGSSTIPVDEDWLRHTDSPELGPARCPLPSHPDVLVDPDGLAIVEGSPALNLCPECYSCLKRHKVPPLSLANHMALGDVPSELKGLTVVEEAMIARCRSKCLILQLKNEEEDKIPSTQRGIKGHIIIYPQRPSEISRVLPPPMSEISTPICIIFIGSKPPTPEWLEKHANPLYVRREKVRAALVWLKANNHLYHDIEINHGLLNDLPQNYTLPVHIEHVVQTDSYDALTSGYDPALAPQRDGLLSMDVDMENGVEVPPLIPLQSDPEAERVAFQNVVIADIDGNAPSRQLTAAAVRHMKKKGGGYIEVGHGEKPENEFFHPELFPMVYPTLFPYGVGGFENVKRTCRVSMKRQVKHLFSLHDRRFQEHFSFLFTVFNVMQKRTVLLHTGLKVKKKNFAAMAQEFASISLHSVHVVSERVARGDYNTANTPDERKVLNLLREVNVLTKHVPGSSASRLAMRNEIRGLIMEKGLPSFYMTINPADVHNPLMKFLAGDEFDIDNMLPDQIPKYKEQAYQVARNPLAAAKFFDIYMKAFIRHILGFDDISKQGNPGVLGTVKAHYGCVEAQGRGTLHCHMVVWLEGALNPDEIKARALQGGSDEFKARMLAYLDDAISNSLPEDPGPSVEVLSSKYHPCTLRRAIPTTPDADPELARQKDLRNLVQRCQFHDHRETCYKYWKGPPQPRECRFDLEEENTTPISSFDVETGEITLRCLHGLVNNFNSTMLQAIRCNMDIKFIGSGPAAKAVLYYITDYITKTQLKAHVAYAALDLAIKKLGERDPEDNDDELRAKRLLQKSAYSMLSHQELSGQQVASYLMGYGDHYTSHEYRSLFWPGFEVFVNKLSPSPECYVKETPPTEQHIENSPNTSDPEPETEEDVQRSASGNQAAEADAGEADPEQERDEAYPDHERDEATPATNSNNDDNDDDEGDEEVTIAVEDNGKVVARANQVQDYQLRGATLDSVCVWDFVKRVEKVRKPSKKSKDSQAITLQDLLGEEQEQEPEEVEGTMETVGDMVEDVLLNNKRCRPTSQFQDEHSECDTHMLRVLAPRKAYVPVPIGPALPRRDRPQLRERYCRLMLILFKPWRSHKELRVDGQSWEAAFGDFIEVCPMECKKVMDNMQLLHECKDSRDDDAIAKQARRRKDRSLFTHVTGSSRVALEDDFLFGEGDKESQMLEHLMAMDRSRSDRVIGASLDAMECVQHGADSGMFQGQSSTTITQEDEEIARELEDAENDLCKEDSWKQTYEDRKKQWRRNASAREAAPHRTEPPQANVSPRASRSIIQSGEAFRNAKAKANRAAPVCQTRSALQPGIPEVEDEMVDVDVESMIEEFGLNTEQGRAFRIVAEHSKKSRPQALRMFLGGPGGTGKSRVINALKSFFDRKKEQRRFRLSSFTGVAAQNIAGMTLHAALSLQSFVRPGAASEKAVRDLRDMWDGVDYLFIDEVSMIGCKMMTRIHRALCKAKENSNEPFGGVNIIFAGDFAQLPPVGETRLYSHLKDADLRTAMKNQDNITGKLLWYSVDTVVMLTENMRQRGEGNEPFAELLDRLRRGDCTDADYDMLSSRTLGKIKPDWTAGWENTPIIVSNNEVKDALNVEATLAFAKKSGRPVHWFAAVDSHKREVIRDPILQRQLAGVHTGKTGNRMGLLPLVIGMPVMITSNFDVQGGVVNGCAGTLTKIRIRNGFPVSCVVRAATVTADNMPYLGDKEVAVMPDTVDMLFEHPDTGKRLAVKRIQLPLVPAFAMTAHKAQGQTMQRVIIDFQTCTGTEQPYVMASRATALDGLLVLRPFEKRRIQCRQSQDARMDNGRMEFLRLKTLVDHGDEEESGDAVRQIRILGLADELGSDINPKTNPCTLKNPSGKLRKLQRNSVKLGKASAPSFPHRQLQKNRDYVHAEGSSIMLPAHAVTADEVSRPRQLIRVAIDTASVVANNGQPKSGAASPEASSSSPQPPVCPTSPQPRRALVRLPTSGDDVSSRRGGSHVDPDHSRYKRALDGARSPHADPKRRRLTKESTFG